ncbi:PREDICTED: uncharacterized protein LOC108369494 isoform X2 [Rhagoletis zephyria]|uniref:uncharacterized protein LOC108369494 isoform X2 n=1 Tax=Rhagoletis zephyria TaxID=28612 RepID=UPI0008118537|nr:PREDICTED: uncharacterized protein LOC108369494 isoform X2 [Rhagoletis zephyria]
MNTNKNKNINDENNEDEWKLLVKALRRREGYDSNSDESSAGERELSASPSKEAERAEAKKVRKRERKKALSQYKAALRIIQRFGAVVYPTNREKERLAWARETVRSERAQLDREHYATTNRRYPNSIEEKHAKNDSPDIKRQKRFTYEDKPLHKAVRRENHDDNDPSTSKAALLKSSAQAKNGEDIDGIPDSVGLSEVAEQHLTVALLDHSDPYGKMTTKKWKSVEGELLSLMIRQMHEEPGKPMPTFDGEGWFYGVKLLKCKDSAALEWLKQAVPNLQRQGDNAHLEVVDRVLIPTIPKAKVWIPYVVKSDYALRLLQAQNPNIPTRDWKVLHVSKTTDEGQSYILQINKEAEDLLYPEYGKMSWGMGSVYLRLKKRNLKDDNTNTLEVGEIEKDLGFDNVTGLKIVDEAAKDGDEVLEVQNEMKDERHAHAVGPSSKSSIQ